MTLSAMLSTETGSHSSPTVLDPAAATSVAASSRRSPHFSAALSLKHSGEDLHPQGGPLASATTATHQEQPSITQHMRIKRLAMDENCILLPHTPPKTPMALSSFQDDFSEESIMHAAASALSSMNPAWQNASTGEGREEDEIGHGYAPDAAQLAEQQNQPPASNYQLEPYAMNAKSSPTDALLMKPCDRDSYANMQQHSLNHLLNRVNTPVYGHMSQPSMEPHSTVSQSDDMDPSLMYNADQETPSSHLESVFGISSPMMLGMNSPPCFGSMAPRLIHSTADTPGRRRHSMFAAAESSMQSFQAMAAAEGCSMGPRRASVQAMLSDSPDMQLRPVGVMAPLTSPFAVGAPAGGGLLGDVEPLQEQKVGKMMEAESLPTKTLMDSDFFQKMLMSASTVTALNMQAIKAQEYAPPQIRTSAIAKNVEPETGHGTFKCTYRGCDKVFERYHNLKSHIRSHSGERPYACNICEMRFSRNHDLKRHERIHSGLRPYVCEHCSKSFLRLDALNRHLKVNGGRGCRSKPKKNEEECDYSFPY